ncbi:MAG: tyrosine-type recombinase/integrase [Kineosporiaceae bacterium]
MTAASRPATRTRGTVERLPSGSLRVKVYAGEDPLTGKRHYLSEVVPAGPKAATTAEKVRARLITQVNEKRHPRTRATVDHLLDRYLEVVELSDSTRRTYVSIIDRHIRPAVGSLAVAALDGETLDRFYAQLRTCRARCRGKVTTDHRTHQAHDCDVRCRPHVCRPLGGSGVRQAHWILSGALARAVKWRWIAVNPAELAEAPTAPTPNARPPSTDDATRILAAALDEEPTWGMFVWLVMVTGMRRGEACALRRRDVDLDAGVVTIAHSVSDVTGVGLKDTKTHQQRRVAVDTATADLLREHFETQDRVAADLGTRLGADAFVFSYSPVADVPMNPSGVTHRYGRLVARLGIDTTLHKLRHYNATELIAAGVDLRTVAGRLGHGGGGTTTLKVYAAWVGEADRRAAAAVATRLRHPKGASPSSPRADERSSAGTLRARTQPPEK